MSEGRDIIEPAQWHQHDDRRVPVLDPNTDPPRVVRYVGWRPCLLCGYKSFSSKDASIREPRKWPQGQNTYKEFRLQKNMRSNSWFLFTYCSDYKCQTVSPSA